MTFNPAGAKWYLAELVQELRVAGDPRNVIWRNLTLVRADSPEDAYQEALRLGRDGDTEYDNPQGNRVEVRFRGLSSLDVIHDELENGAELLFSSENSVSEERLAAILQTKESLGVFRPTYIGCVFISRERPGVPIQRSDTSPGSVRVKARSSETRIEPYGRVSPVPTTQHAIGTSGSAIHQGETSSQIRKSHVTLVGGTVARRCRIPVAETILHPLQYVAVHIVEAERVRRK